MFDSLKQKVRQNYPPLTDKLNESIEISQVHFDFQEKAIFYITKNSWLYAVEMDSKETAPAFNLQSNNITSLQVIPSKENQFADWTKQYIVKFKDESGQKFFRSIGYYLALGTD